MLAKLTLKAYNGLFVTLFLKSSKNTMSILTEKQCLFLYLIERNLNEMITSLNMIMPTIKLDVRCIKDIVYSDMLTLLASNIKCIETNSLVDGSNTSSCIQ